MPYYGRSMNNKNQKTKKRLPLTLTIIGILLVVGIVAGLIFRDTIKTVATDIQTNIENQGKPKFIFDTEKHPDWATAGNVFTNLDITDDFQGSKEDLPISGIIVNQCTTGSNCNTLVDKCKPQNNGNSKDCKQLAKYTTDTHCFVSLFYNERNVDPEQEVAKYIEHNNSFGSMTITEAGVKNLTMNTPDGNKEYKLHYYNYENKSAETIKKGNAIGYISLTNGHIDIRSVCSETNQLDETLPILSAIRLEV